MDSIYHKRNIEIPLKEFLFRDRAIVLLGPRRVGKTTLYKHLMETGGKDSVYFNCDEIATQELLQPYSLETIKHIIGQKKLVVIDEAQKVKNIENTIKLIVDNIADVQVLITGSNSLDLGRKIKENLTGRIIELYINTFTLDELYEKDVQKIMNSLNHHLIYGTYPHIQGEDIKFQEKNLKDLSQKHLVRDLQDTNMTFNSILMQDLLRVLAHSVGSEMTYNSLSNKLGVNKETIQRYIYILEKSYIIFRIYPYRKNAGKTVNRIRKVYFYDNGLRNALIDDFKPLAIRNDVGALFENFIYSEIYKTHQAKERDSNFFYWRNNKKQEVDLVIQKNNLFTAFEFKYSKDRFSTPKAILNDLEIDEVKLINKNNFYTIYSI